MDSIEKVLFTIAVRKQGRISFLDVLMNKSKLKTTVDRKSINNNIHLNWKSNWYAKLMENGEP